MMRFAHAFILILSGLGLAQGRGHRHNRFHKKGVGERDVIEEHVAVTVVECQLGTHIISEEECMQGIHNGTLKWASDGTITDHSSSTTKSKVKISSSTASGASSMRTSSSSKSVQATTSVEAKPTSTTATSSQSTQSAQPPQYPSTSPGSSDSPSSYSGSSSGSSTGSSCVDKHFPDGEIDCGTFPSEYGAVKLEWLGLGGWGGVQKPGSSSSGGFSDIMEVTKAQCKIGNCCLEGAYCNYACPPGLLRYQWPSTQGLTGQSVGGLLCKGGKLYKTNPAYNTLCAPGAAEVKVFVQNKLTQNVAVCQTLYPGNEKMAIPVDAQPGSTEPLACPDSATYYTWQGKGTSAQYYINMPGYSIEKACVWGKDGDDFGNFAPTNLGVGYSNGAAWLSVFQNLPTQPNAKLPYTIDIVGDSTSDKCRYKDGQYCSGVNYGTCSDKGCTVSAKSGNVYFVLS